MFMASIIVCGLWLDKEEPRCTVFSDEYGPFRTEENCRIRTTQLEADLLSEKFYSSLMALLDFPHVVTSAQICEKTDDIES